METTKGTYIAFEGVVKCGKTTQSKLFVEHLKKLYLNREVIWTREPGGSEIADEIRRVVQGTPFKEEMHPIAEAYLYAASRAHTLRTVIGPALERNAIVVSDRSYWTSAVFQGFGRGLGYGKVMSINDDAVGDLKPDKVVFIDMPDLNLAMQRAIDVLGDKFENMPLEFFQKCREGYLYLAKCYPEHFLTIDGTGSIEEVHQRIAQALMGFV